MATSKVRKITQEQFDLLKAGKPAVINLTPRPKLGSIFTVVGLTDTETLQVRCSQHGGVRNDANCVIVQHD